MAEPEAARSDEVLLGTPELTDARDSDVASADKMAVNDHADMLSQGVQSVDPGMAPATAAPQAASSVPQQKKFASSNINKKFLEKTGSGQGPVPTTSQAAGTKLGTPTRMFAYIIGALFTLLTTFTASETCSDLKCFALSSCHDQAHDRPTTFWLSRPRLVTSILCDASSCTWWYCRKCASDVSAKPCARPTIFSAAQPTQLSRWKAGVESHSSTSSTEQDDGP